MKNELIGRKALIESFRAMNNTGADCFPVNVIIETIEEAPAVDAVSVRHGRWEEIRNAYGELEGWLCKCGHEVKSKDKYCPNCGAKMGGRDVTD